MTEKEVVEEVQKEPVFETSDTVEATEQNQEEAKDHDAVEVAQAEDDTKSPIVEKEIPEPFKDDSQTDIPKDETDQNIPKDGDDEHKATPVAATEEGQTDSEVPHELIPGPDLSRQRTARPTEIRVSAGAGGYGRR